MVTVTVALPFTLSDPETLKVLVAGMMKLIPVLPLPTTTKEPRPVTLQLDAMVGLLPFTILYSLPAVLKVGCEPVPSVFKPQLFVFDKSTPVPVTQ